MAAFTSGNVQVPQAVPVSHTHTHHTHGTVTEKEYGNHVTADRHDPHDEWSSRDLLLSTVPFIIAVAFRDAALHAGLIVALAMSVYILFKRHAFWGGFGKRMWPVYDITNVILFAIMLGCSWEEYDGGARNTIHRWLIVIICATFAIVAAISLAIRRPFTSHYAHFAHFDAGGHGLWQADSAWRAVNDKSTFTWFSVWAIACLLALIPALTGKWHGYKAVNIIFHYIVPLGLVAIALMVTQLLGRKYSRQAVATTTTTTTTAPRTAVMV